VKRLSPDQAGQRHSVSKTGMPSRYCSAACEVDCCGFAGRPVGDEDVSGPGLGVIKTGSHFESCVQLTSLAVLEDDVAERVVPAADLGSSLASDGVMPGLVEHFAGAHRAHVVVIEDVLGLATI
jgi:hypothetical protein